MEEERLEQSSEVLETTNTETAENVEEVVEQLTDTAETKQAVKSLKELLKENPNLQEEFNNMTKNRLRRQERELAEKYSRTETVLKAGLGVDNLEQATDKLADFYKSKGITIPDHSFSNGYDMEAGAEKEANEIINSGYVDLVEEVDRLAEKGIDRMTAREKLVFTKLAEERQRQESIKELAQIGVKPEALKDSEYIEFANKLNPDLSSKEKYELYLKFKPKSKIETVGSMKSVQRDKTKDYYSEDEISRMSLDDLDDPRVWEAVRKSMTGQN